MEKLTEKDLNFDLKADTQKEALHALAEQAFERGKIADTEIFYQELCNREKESTTGFGNGVAIPHARHGVVQEAGILVARCKNNLEWNSMDGEPVNVCICLIAPDDQNDFHLKTLAKISRRMIHDDFIDTLKNASEADVLAEINKVIE
ncbi:PTS fructose transporter subunit IIA [Enterococcus hulanensis]|uniref:PTS fructose transporter subunit IIA n=1 Tax=Enterococcus hulanensis TaxID=2559929 RepID=A0ABU3F157_9ENTE|nr:PTS fructose transporter subunit IIA [Enterococcus hulanensis]MDT2600852.1 PTS fructose transporter subunit IIA [Enterococcus hulanensis]MDT2611927.1 PTS fructose transporter subunit IIA [Enterococcus hulanensis]MDT2618075.1 PTS fructose transporter subunit IIA [Enterococcus hulanensis]MDT2629078.1 PTS fructose transporter subunit IIA [Enterococcus hulanensis]MDT2656640.1 PTS fructose transporter subunit IIA [Enterococcus hulanensis]